MKSGLIGRFQDRAEEQVRRAEEGAPRSMSLIAQVDGVWVYGAGKFAGEEVMPEEVCAELEDYFVWAVEAGAVPAWQREEHEELEAFFEYAKVECGRRREERERSWLQQVRERSRQVDERQWGSSSSGAMAVVKRHWPFADLDKSASMRLQRLDYIREGLELDEEDVPHGAGGVMWGDGPNIW